MSAGSSSVRRLVDQFDQSDKPLSEMEIVDAIRVLPLHAPLTEEDLAEYLAFAFIGQGKASVSPGATYFRPCFQGTDQDGKQFEWPNVAEITPIMTEYWSAPKKMLRTTLPNGQPMPCTARSALLYLSK